MEKLNDNAYVMMQRRRAMDSGKLSEALSLISETRQEEGDTLVNWRYIRTEMDNLPPSLTRNQATDRYLSDLAENTDFDGYSRPQGSVSAQ